MIAIRSFPQDNIIVARATALQERIIRKARKQGHDSPDDFFAEVWLELLKKARQEDPEEITDAYVWRLVNWRLCDWHRNSPAWVKRPLRPATPAACWASREWRPKRTSLASLFC